MTAPLTNGSMNSIGRKMASHTITGLKRWSCQSKELPPVSQIKAIHVYDFDNTLFSSPLPNLKLWTGPTVGHLQTQEGFANGGWWHDHHILEATGEGADKEELRAWAGWWNEHIVNLVELSMQQKDAVNVLLTGRGEHNFADLVKRIVTSKKLDFHMVCLKPQVGPNNQRFLTTMGYKQSLLEDLVYTYKEADEIRVYEDRPRHVKGFRDYFEKFNKMLLSPNAPTPRKPITAEVIQVAEGIANLDPITEAAEVQRMINSHNIALRSGVHSLFGRLQMKRTIFYTGYLISPADTAKLLTLISLPQGMPESEIKFLANNILITPRPCPKSILDKVGGIGKTLTWQITGTAVYENKIWAARVSPVPETEKYYTENPVPIIVLALRKGARPIDAGRIQNWQPVAPDKAFIFETVVGEKVQLRVEEEVEGENEWESLFANKNNKRRHPQEDVYHFHPQAPHGPQHQHHQHHQHFRPGNEDNRRVSGGGPNNGYRGGNHNNNNRGRGGGGGGGGQRHPPHGGRGGRGNNHNRGGGGRGRGRGGGHGNYRSLDDVGDRGGMYGQGNASQNVQPSYDEGGYQGPGVGVDQGGYNAAFPPLGGAFGNATGIATGTGTGTGNGNGRVGSGVGLQYNNY
ncbi:MAG: hypothetical protein M1830_003845 [Pleopsidium flavum]|nr:MAG: hypothetical protein M1830_003845 [Pleopsidium flavum]